MENLKVDVRLTKIKTEDNFRGYASIIVNDAIVVNSIKIFEGSKGLFVKYPQKEVKDGVFRGVAFPTKEASEKISEKIISAYKASV